MGNSLLTGIWRTLVRVPPFLWEKQIEKARHRVKKSICFMTFDHQRVHHYVVRELPRIGRPIPPEADCHPVIFVPDVNFSRLKDPNIIDAF